MSRVLGGPSFITQSVGCSACYRILVVEVVGKVGKSLKLLLAREGGVGGGGW